jgi:DNA-binding transcriptional regulator GbsR (MarR family)
MADSTITQRFILHWGEMGSRWGVNRTVAQIHALLYLSPAPLPAEDIAERLSVARSHVSISLKELKSWKLVRIVHLREDRRDHFECVGDIWDLARTIVSGRREREIMPTAEALHSFIDAPDFDHEPEHARQRIREMAQFVDVVTRWSDEMLKLDPATLGKLLKLGAGVQRTLDRVRPAARRAGSKR